MALSKVRRPRNKEKAYERKRAKRNSLNRRKEIKQKEILEEYSINIINER